MAGWQFWVHRDYLESRDRSSGSFVIGSANGSHGRTFRHGCPRARSVELICLKGGFDVIRSRLPAEESIVVVRTGLSKVRPVPGELFTLQVERSWIFGHTCFAKGLITATRLEVSRLGLQPLGLREWGAWVPDEEPWLFEELDQSVYSEIWEAGQRVQCEMEQVLPEDAVELRLEEDPISEAAELAAAGARDEAENLLGDLLVADLRCLDAHAHLGNLAFSSSWPGALDRAGRHYRVGLEIADLTLGVGFRDLLPWGLLDNRPYLRCLNGYGLYLWRKGDPTGAGEVFRRLLWLNPSDNQGARFNLGAVEAGIAWQDAGARDERAPGR